jgi:hypothetical protein
VVFLLAVEIGVPGQSGAGLLIECQPRGAIGGVEFFEIAVDVVPASGRRARRERVKVSVEVWFSRR